MTKVSRFIALIGLLANLFIFSGVCYALTCTIDEKTQVLFGNSVQIEGYLGFQNYTYDYVGGWLHITGTISQAHDLFASYPIYWRVIDKNCSIESATEIDTKEAWYQKTYSGDDDWFTVELQFSATGVISTMYHKDNPLNPITGDFPKTTEISGIAISDYVYIYNTYPTTPLSFSMTFTPILISNVSAISISSPTSGSTITDLSTHLVGTWQGINHEIYPYIWLSFIEPQIYEHSKIYSFEITGDTGGFEIPLSNFDFTKNGRWDFRAMAEYDANTFLDLSPEVYYLTLDVDGLPSPYYFTNFEDWYHENVDEYADPSAWSSAMVGYLEPIFSKIGEFGNRITDYLDTSLGYERGRDIGGVFPVIIAYVGKIDMFFGGFPIVAFFKWLIFIMIGLFVVKVILKLLSFIPFFGGGG